MAKWIVLPEVHDNELAEILASYEDKGYVPVFIIPQATSFMWNKVILRLKSSPGAA